LELIGFAESKNHFLQQGLQRKSFLLGQKDWRGKPGTVACWPLQHVTLAAQIFNRLFLLKCVSLNCIIFE